MALHRIPKSVIVLSALNSHFILSKLFGEKVSSLFDALTDLFAFCVQLQVFTHSQMHKCFPEATLFSIIAFH